MQQNSNGFVCSQCVDHDAELIRLRGLNASLTARIAAASDVLGKIAEKGGVAELAVRFMAALERIATDVATLDEAKEIAAVAAGLKLPTIAMANVGAGI